MTATVHPRQAFLLFVLMIWGICPSPGAVGAEPDPGVIRVMSFNLWHGGDAGKQPFERTVAVVKESRADIVGLQETGGARP